MKSILVVRLHAVGVLEPLEHLSTGVIGAMTDAWPAAAGGTPQPVARTTAN